ncbi:MAG: hypothetical protein H7249_13155 [Chitinophagaceae bacterium]|nr:hypothetical protein [Oligoflexus sp.]
MTTGNLLCEVCYRPTTDPICSRRCQGLLKLKKRLSEDDLRRLVLVEVRKLPKDSSIAPGPLARIVLDELGGGPTEERDAFSLLRKTLFDLRREGGLRFFQKNKLIPKAKGPAEFQGCFEVRGS